MSEEHPPSRSPGDQAPAGWYPQPDGRQRYWDGAGWVGIAAQLPSFPQPESTQTHGRVRGAMSQVWGWVVGAAMLLGLLVAVLFTSVLGFGPIQFSSSNDGVAPEESAGCDGAVSWKAAESLVGEQATVKGPLVSVTTAQSSKGEPTFLNIGAAYPDPGRLSVVMWHTGPNAANFSPPDEGQYSGPTLCVTGEVRDFEGVPQITVTDESQIAFDD